MVTPPLVIARMTELATQEVAPEPASQPPAVMDDASGERIATATEDQGLSLNPIADLPDHDDGVEDVPVVEERDTRETDHVGDSDPDDREELPPVHEETVLDDGLGDEWQEVRRRRHGDLRRSERVVKKPARYAAHQTQTQRPKDASRPVKAEGESASHHAFHVSARKGIKEYGVAAYNAIMREFEQLYPVKDAIAPVMPSELTSEEWTRVIRSSLFLNPKHDAMGVFQKIKARLVANGKQQDKELYPDRSSPTAMLESIMVVLTVCAHEQRSMAGLDIGSAFLEAVWVGEPVHIVVEKMLATMLVHKYPELRAYLREDGSLVMRIKKALYGTLIAGKLWFDKLTGVLRDMGFVANEIDPCVMNKTVDGDQLTVVIFVDDILATHKEDKALTWLIEELKIKFDDVKGGVEVDLSYLGMHLKNKQSEGKVEVSMEGYEGELLNYAKITGVRKTPATSHLFDIGSSPSLGVSDLAHFHTLVAKLLYLSLRTRPQICVAVSYLTTRVTCANKDDMEKLNRVLMYISSTADDNKLTLLCRGALRVTACVDVAFGSREDGKSQTGVSHHVGEATVSAKSQKQKMVSKDSTEGELVGLTDRVDGVLRLDEFMKSQGHVMELPVIYQDNQSTIWLVTKGGGKYRNVHLRVRQRRLQEKIMNKEIIVAYLSTGNMTADVLTKPLQGQLFLAMVAKLLNRERAPLTGVR